MNISLKGHGKWGACYGNPRIKRDQQIISVAVYRRNTVTLWKQDKIINLVGLPAEADLLARSLSGEFWLDSAGNLTLFTDEWHGFNGRTITVKEANSLLSRFGFAPFDDDDVFDYVRLSTTVAIKHAFRGPRIVDYVPTLVAYTEASTAAVTQQNKATADGGKPSPRNVILSITGQISEITSNHFIIDWYGGGKLKVTRSSAQGDWDDLKVGDWIEATIARKMNGEVISAMLVRTIDPPQGFSQEDLDKSYSSIPPAALDPVD